jgi:hypothetical protein
MEEPNLCKYLHWDGRGEGEKQRKEAITKRQTKDNQIVVAQKLS